MVVGRTTLKDKATMCDVHVIVLSKPDLVCVRVWEGIRVGGTGLSQHMVGGGRLLGVAMKGKTRSDETMRVICDVYVCLR